MSQIPCKQSTRIEKTGDNGFCPMTAKYFEGGFNMNIYYRCSKIFKVNFDEVVFAVLTLSDINITMLVKIFSLSLLQWLFSGAPRIWQSGA